MYLRKLDWQKAEESFRRAIELNPSLTQIHASYSISTLIPLGKLTEAEEGLRRALQSDPLSLSLQRELASLQFITGRYRRRSISWSTYFRSRPLLDRGEVSSESADVRRQAVGGVTRAGVEESGAGRATLDGSRVCPGRPPRGSRKTDSHACPPVPSGGDLCRAGRQRSRIRGVGPGGCQGAATCGAPAEGPGNGGASWRPTVRRNSQEARPAVVMTTPASGRSDVRRRAPCSKKRSRGLRELRLVVPDTRSPSVRRRVAAQVAHLSKAGENDALNWIESVSEFDAPDAPRKR